MRPAIGLVAAHGMTWSGNGLVWTACHPDAGGGPAAEKRLQHLPGQVSSCCASHWSLAHDLRSNGHFSATDMQCNQ